MSKQKKNKIWNFYDWRFFPFATGVKTTPVVHLELWISPRILEYLCLGGGDYPNLEYSDYTSYPEYQDLDKRARQSVYRKQVLFLLTKFNYRTCIIESNSVMNRSFCLSKDAFYRKMPFVIRVNIKTISGVPLMVLFRLPRRNIEIMKSKC